MLKQQIIECGFTEAQADAAMKRKSTLEGAIHWILSPEGAAVHTPAPVQIAPVLQAAPAPASAAAAVTSLAPAASLVHKVVGMGFSEAQAQTAADHGETVEACIEWLLGGNHVQGGEAPPAAPAPPAPPAPFVHPNALVQQILRCGMDFITVQQAEAAAKRHNDIERCIEWILARGNSAEGEAGAAVAADEEEVRDCVICYCDEPQSNMVLCECKPEQHWVCRECLQAVLREVRLVGQRGPQGAGAPLHRSRESRWRRCHFEA